MNEIITRLHRTKLVPAVISIAFGIALIIARSAAMEVVVKITAGMLIACGVGCVLMFLFAPVKESMQLAIGGLAAAIGFLVWFNSDFVVRLFPILTGIYLVLNGLSNLAPLSMPDENAGRGLIILFSVLMFIAGLFIIFHPAAVEDTLMLIVGISYVVNGILDLILLHRVKDILLNRQEKA